MPVEDLSEEGLPKVPNLDLAQLKFLISIQPNDKSLKEKLVDEIDKNAMTPFYLESVKDGLLSLDEKLVEKLRTINETKFKEFDAKIEENEKAFGDSEVRESYLAKANYYCSIGDREQALVWLRKTSEKTVTLGHRLDLIFYQLRLGLFYMDQDLLERNLEKAKTLVDEGGDWDRRNRMKVYQGLRAMSIRDFKSAADLFLETVATFTSYELMDYQKFVTYTVLCSLFALERPKLREKGLFYFSSIRVEKIRPKSKIFSLIAFRHP